MNAPCLQVILCLCMFINGVMLTFYVTVGYRGLEAFARSNWTIGTKPPRNKAAAASHRDVKDKDLPNKTSEVTIEFTPEAPPEVTTKALTKVTTTVAQNTTVGFSLRELSAIARNNWTIGSEAWRSNPAIELQRGVEGKDLPNNTSEVAVEFTPEAKTEITPKATTEVTPKATTKATTEVSKKATREGAKIVAKDATAPLTSGGVPVDGLTFDLIFGTETSLNLASDIWMQVTLSSWQSPGTKTKLGLFLGWNALTTAVCYVMSLSLADFNSRLVPYKPGEIKGTEEEAQYRSTLKTSGIIKYTSLLVVKVCVLGCILKFFVDWERLAEQSRLQEGQAYPFGIAAPWPTAYPAQPGAYPAPPGAYPAPPGGFPALGQWAYPTPYYVNPSRGVGGAPPAGYPPPKAVLPK